MDAGSGPALKGAWASEMMDWLCLTAWSALSPHRNWFKKPSCNFPGHSCLCCPLLVPYCADKYVREETTMCFNLVSLMETENSAFYRAVRLYPLINIPPSNDHVTYFWIRAWNWFYSWLGKVTPCLVNETSGRFAVLKVLWKHLMDKIDFMHNLGRLLIGQRWFIGVMYLEDVSSMVFA